MFPPATTSYVAIAAEGTELGKGSLMIQAFKVDPASTNTTITLTNTSTTLTYTANLHNAAPTGVTAGTANITLDWGMMTTNALGGQFVTTNITSALIGHYTQSVGQLEQDFLNLETLPSALYRGGIDIGTVVDFSMLTTMGGQAFPGIDDTGTWLLGLECGNCGIPAPWYLTVLKVCTPRNGHAARRARSRRPGSRSPPRLRKAVRASPRDVNRWLEEAAPLRLAGALMWARGR